MRKENRSQRCVDFPQGELPTFADRVMCLWMLVCERRFGITMV
jgi:hypothetical protein